MTSPAMLSALAAAAVFLIFMGIRRPEEGIVSERTKTSLIKKIDIKLKRAGLVTFSAATVLSALTMIMVLAFLVFFIALGNLIFALIPSIAVPFLFSLYLDKKARHYQDQLTGHLVPFLRKITAQVRTGQNPTRAFAVAASEDPLLAWVLREQLANLQLQQPFQDVLKDTLAVMPLRPWVQFVRSMERFAKSGGELSEILESNVSRIQSQVVLRQRLMGDVGTYRGQQIVLLVFALIIPIGLVMMSPEMFGKALKTPLGIIAIIISLGLDALSFWITNNAIKDVERKMES